MVGLVITIAQRKGGAEKTTLATQFAVTWARRGARVAALDIELLGLGRSAPREARGKGYRF